MSLPTGRNTTYSPGVQIKSEDVNDIQDCIVGGKNGQVTLIIPASAGHSYDTHWQWLASIPSSAGAAEAWIQPDAANELVSYPLPLRVGDRILGYAAHIMDTAGGHTVSMELGKSDSSTGNMSQVGSTQTSAGDGTRQTLAETGLTETVVAGMFYAIAVISDDGTGTTHKSFGVRVTIDHP